MTLGENLKAARNRASLTQRESAQKTGINPKTISNWENDVSRPSPDDLIRLAVTYGTSVDSLLGNPVDFLHLNMSSAMGKAVAKEHEKAGYYHDPKVAAMVDELKNRPGMRILFDASRDLSEDDINFVVQFVERLKKK